MEPEPQNYFMSQTDLEQLEEDILRRLSAVDLTSVSINQPIIAFALEKYLEVLQLAPRPITWASDGDHAQALAAASVLVPASEIINPPVDPEYDSEFKRND